MTTEDCQSKPKFNWTAADSALQLLQAANFALDFDNFCTRILRGTFSYLGFEICIYAKVVSKNLANCLGYFDVAGLDELEIKAGSKEKDHNLLAINLDQDLLLKISSGEPHWQSPSSISITRDSVSNSKTKSHQLALVVPLPVFFEESGFLLLCSSKEKLTREVTRSEIEFLQWTVATYILINKSKAELHSIKNSGLGIFTIRQQKIYEYLLSGLTNVQIARMLNVSVSTIKAEIGAIYSRLGVHKRSELRNKHEF